MSECRNAMLSPMKEHRPIIGGVRTRSLNAWSANAIIQLFPMESSRGELFVHGVPVLSRHTVADIALWGPKDVSITKVVESDMYWVGGAVYGDFAILTKSQGQQ